MADEANRLPVVFEDDLHWLVYPGHFVLQQHLGGRVVSPKVESALLRQVAQVALSCTHLLHRLLLAHLHVLNLDLLFFVAEVQLVHLVVATEHEGVLEGHCGALCPDAVAEGVEPGEEGFFLVGEVDEDLAFLADEDTVAAAEAEVAERRDFA